jgi:uncharacterized protein YjiS (DUF1127 family)
MSTITDRVTAHTSATHAPSAPGPGSRLREFGSELLAVLAGIGAGLARSFEASRQAAQVTERYLRMTDERLAGYGLTRRDVERRIRDITCRDV